MSEAKFAPEVYVRLATANPSWSNRQIAYQLGVDESSVRRAFRAADFVRHLVPDLLDFEDELDTPIWLNGPVVITADWHEPITDHGYVNEMILEARQSDIRKLVIAGDFWNFDALSAYDPKQITAGLEREWRTGVAVMATVLESFDEIVYIWGNHDARMHRALAYKMRFDMAMRMMFGELGDDALAKIRFSSLDHCWVQTNRGPYYVCHPSNYSRIPLSTARALIAKTGTHVITAHSHHCAVGYGIDGLHIAAEAGGFFDASKTAYLQRTSTFPTWQQGYAIIDHYGQLCMRSPGWNT